MAKPRSHARSGNFRQSMSALPAANRARCPSRLQVSTRCLHSPPIRFASSMLATLSGLSPERENDTIRVGVRSATYEAGLATRSVVAMASTGRRSPAPNHGARVCPMYADEPAPHRTSRSRGSSNWGPSHSPMRVRRRFNSAFASLQAKGCSAISRAVSKDFAAIRRRLSMPRNAVTANPRPWNGSRCRPWRTGP